MRRHEVAFAALAMLWISSVAMADEGADLLAKLAETDARYTWDFEATGVEYIFSLNDRRGVSLKRTWAASAFAEDFAAEYTTVDLLPPEGTYTPLATQYTMPGVIAHELLFSDVSEMTLARWLTRSWTPGPLDSTAPYSVSSITRNPPCVDYRPGKAYLYFQLGRGYSAYLDRVRKIEKEGDELHVTVIGTGFRGAGTWTLTILPDADYMVSRATFHRKPRKSGGDFISIETKGVQWFGPRCAPRSGEMYADLLPGSTGFTVTSLGQSAGTKLHDKLQKLLTAPYSTQTVVTDLRVYPQTRYVYGPGDETGTAIGATPPGQETGVPEEDAAEK